MNDLEQHLKQNSRDAQQAKHENTELQRCQSMTQQQQQELDKLAEQKEILEERNQKLKENGKLTSQLHHSSDESTIQHGTTAVYFDSIFGNKK
jgi:hypothetical protein